MKLTRSRYSPIGIDLGRRAIKAAQFRYDGDSPVLARVASIPRTAGDTTVLAGEVARLMSVLSRMDFRGNRFVLSIPASAMLTSVMELPPRSSGAPLNAIARQELARSHKADASAIEMTWWELPGGARANEGTHVMAVGCKHSDAEALIDVFEAVGGEVVAIDAPTLALVRAARARLAPPPAMTALVDLSWSSADLVIVRDRTIVYERSMRELGLATLITQVKASLGVDDDSAEFLVRQAGCASPQPHDEAKNTDAQPFVSSHVEALATELKMSIAYASRRFGSETSGVLLTGGVASLPGLALRLGELTQVPANVLGISNTHHTDIASLSAFDAATLMTAVGLAMHGESKAVAA